MIKVHLIDGHAVVRAGVRRLLEGEKGIRVVAESASVAEGLKDLAGHRPDIVILDVAPPAGEGLDATERLRRESPATQVVILALQDDGLFPVRALKAGARGYLTGTSRPEDLAHAVRAVAAGEVYLEPAVARALALRPFSGERDPLDALTDREFGVFCMLARGESVKAIADSLCLSPKTVGACRTRIMKALEAHNVAELAHIAIRRGLVAI